MKKETEEKVCLPVVHLNGTSRETLYEGYYRAYEALRLFERELGETVFHARDYYPKGETAWEEARAQRHEVHLKLKDIKEYLKAFVNHLYE